jgi:hypothetical protein
MMMQGTRYRIFLMVCIVYPCARCRIITHFQLKRRYETAIGERVHRFFHEPERLIDFRFEPAERNWQPRVSAGYEPLMQPAMVLIAQQDRIS